jgi:hypothetical protein
MAWKRIAAIAAIGLIGGAFLARYLPEHRLRTAAEQEAMTLREQLAAAEARGRMGQLLGQTLVVREVVVRQNYGQARELSSAFFDQRPQGSRCQPGRRFPLGAQRGMSRRDSVTASLAKADPGTVEVLHTIELQMRRALGYPVPQETTAK